MADPFRATQKRNTAGVKPDSSMGFEKLPGNV